jgi:hypothetical protein
MSMSEKSDKSLGKYVMCEVSYFSYIIKNPEVDNEEQV